MPRAVERELWRATGSVRTAGVLVAHCVSVMTRTRTELTLAEVVTEPVGPEVARVALATDRGTIECRYHHADTGDAAVLWVFGAGGGLGGPAGGVYERLGARLAAEGLASLQLAYRRPGDLVECVLDVLAGIRYLETRGRTRVVLVGHSFGGAVVITAGAASEAVIAVAALSSQLAGTQAADRLAPRPLLVAHGTDDEILPDRCSRDIHARAKEPKRLILYPGCRHGLDACRDALDRDLTAWLREVAGLSVGESR
jgi:alpha-beta hydrolase superfamily lysophospholipase